MSRVPLVKCALFLLFAVASATAMASGCMPSIERDEPGDLVDTSTEKLSYHCDRLSAAPNKLVCAFHDARGGWYSVRSMSRTPHLPYAGEEIAVEVKVYKAIRHVSDGCGDGDDSRTEIPGHYWIFERGGVEYGRFVTN